MISERIITENNLFNSNQNNSLNKNDDLNSKSAVKPNSTDKSQLPDDTINLVEQGALGMIETEGFIAAIVGADAALKAANVSLLALGKVGSAIVTVLLVGDVGAISAAVDAGCEAVKQVGVLRTGHIIPRLSRDVAIKMIHPVKPLVVKAEPGASDETEVLTLEKTKTDFPAEIIPIAEIKADNQNDTNDAIEKSEIKNKTIINSPAKAKSNNNLEPAQSKAKDQEETEILDQVNSYNEVELLEKSNMELREMIAAIDKDISSTKLKSMRKEELINHLNELKKHKQP